MKIINQTVNFNRKLTRLEKIEKRAYTSQAKQAIGLENLAIITHSVSLPSNADEDFGIGILSKNNATLAYLNFLYDNSIDSMSIEPLGIISGEFYSPYEGTLLSKKPIIDLNLLCQDEWANILDESVINKVVKDKNYNVQVKNSNGYSNVEFEKDMVIYDYVLQSQQEALKLAYKNFNKKVKQGDLCAQKINNEFIQFKEQNDYFLQPNAIYTVLNKKYQKKTFKEWENDLHKSLFDENNAHFSKKQRLEEIEKIENQHKGEIEFFKFCQFLADKQLKDVANYAANLSLIRYNSDLKVLDEAFENGDISCDKYTYLKSKIEEYKNNSQGVKIIGDKQVGYSDMDIFSCPSCFTQDEFMGAPPNLIKKSKGQEWDFSFISYEKLFNDDNSLALGGEFLKKAMKKAFKDNPGGLRIDHIIGIIDPWTYSKDNKLQAPENVVNGSRHIFKYLLNNELNELKQYGLNEQTIRGVIDPIKGVFDEKSLERQILEKNGVFDFDKIKEIILSKRDELDKIYSNVIENIILAAAQEVVSEKYVLQGRKIDKNQIFDEAIKLLICEDLGALTIPVREVMKKYNLKGMRDAGRANPYDKNYIFRESNPNEQENYWLISTHDTPSYKNIIKKYDSDWQNSTFDYLEEELGLPKLKRDSLFELLKAKVVRIFCADKNPKTKNNVILNWLDLFEAKRQYNTPGLYDKTKNWNLRICASDESFEKKYYEDIIPNKKGINIPKALCDSLKICTKGKKYDRLAEELDKISCAMEE